MFGTRFEVTQDTPEDLWLSASSRRREVWLTSRGFHTDYAGFKFHDLPLYIQNRWGIEV